MASLAGRLQHLKRSPRQSSTVVKSSIIVGSKAEGRISKPVLQKEQSTPSFPKNEHSLSPDTHTHVYVLKGKKFSFFGKFGKLCFLVTPVLRFAPLPYYPHYFFINLV